ncbi:molybdopterin cofactor-binding domain-containing protein [Massilia sp. TS11]|uniref:xanthine dehydrogenase family protein molybdopterin-binding subunit n=1 Tax=Massilia sp. TS11 TaxID=2908003 RepID=UPI001EDBB74C|nr:molybdopterin cofactor-binding domain-containing protein [Massilia sp. TS11]MCG2586460.1 molybdopterin-dependent oxidoreductase [Massilia sp. TS11]
MKRRAFLQLLGASGGGLLLSAKAAPAGLDVGYYLRIWPDNSMLFTFTHFEMGQGVATAMALVFAETLGVRLDQLKVAPVASTADGRYTLGGTGGSNTIKNQYQPLRRGATLARQALLAAAAERFGQPAATLQVAEGQVRDPASGRAASFGELAERAVALAAPPATAAEFEQRKPELAPAGAPSAGAPNVYADAIVRGQHPYGLDRRLPGMLVAVLARSPRHRGRLLRFDASRALAIPGVKAVFRIDGAHEAQRGVAAPATRFSTQDAVAVLAENSWAALRGREALQVEWEAPAVRAGGEDTASWSQHLDDRLASAQPLLERGAAVSGSSLEARYDYPFQAHLCMEPMNAVAHHQGTRAEVWVGAQSPGWWRDHLSTLFGIPVTIYPQFAGGAFGRRYYMDTALEALRVSAAAGNLPVQVLWTRSDDIRHDHVHPHSRQAYRAQLDGQGRLASFAHTETRAYFGDASGEIPWFAYDSAHYRYAFAECQSSSPLQGGAWRSVVANAWAFGQECFIDELAALAQQDPLQFRLRQMASGAPQAAGRRYQVDQQRQRRVLEAVARLSGWASSSVRGRGIAAYPYLHGDSYCAMVVEVARRDGAWRITRVVAAVDCGRVINPDGARQQIEGGIIWGLSAALHGGLQLRAGAVVNSNFHDTPMLRLHETPERIEVHFVGSPEAPPTGLGEIAPPVVVPALANALYAATGVRQRQLPLTLD